MVLTLVLPDIPVLVSHQVRLGQDLVCVENGEQAVVLVIVLGESVAEGVAEVLSATFLRTQSKSVGADNISDNSAVVLIPWPFLAIAPAK